jgi:hypothetical protein
LQAGVTGSGEQAHPDRDGLGLVLGKHQRRQLVPAPQHIPDAGCALDRDAPRLQCRDIPVDGAHRDLQLVGDRGCGHWPRGGAQDADDVEQAVCAA